ncbi:MAG: MBL fold metallo-hydrolase [Thermoguttaceae bacterium]|nr:MBL fold metallo-hydrolase [Thermoguttaceae bacterium]
MQRREFLEATALFGIGAALESRITPQKTIHAAEVGAKKDPIPVLDPDGEVGKPYRGWKEGELDLHFIHTGVGENCFQIYPDGTTALVDAGDRDAEVYKENVPIKPNRTRRAGEWIARYVARLRPGLEKIDYVVISHFHSDHTGCSDYGVGMTTGRGADYQISGVSHVGEFYRFGKAFDRGYPDYDYPSPSAPEERDNLLKFFDYAEKEYGMKREAFRVGALDQIALVNEPEKYDFHIRNICANGVVWDGEGDKTTAYFDRWPENKKRFSENIVSLVTTIQFGPFRFYSGGDVGTNLAGDDGKPFNLEVAVGKAVGPVDVCKSNHHSYLDSMVPGFVKEVRPRVFVTCVWDRWHLQDNTASAMCDETLYPDPRIICPTTIHPKNAEMMEGKPWRKYLVERTGSVVVKAYDGGKKYKVYYITAEDESMTVDAVYGPFDAKGAV